MHETGNFKSLCSNVTFHKEGPRFVEKEEEKKWLMTCSNKKQMFFKCSQ